MRALAVALAVLASPVAAGGNCAPRDIVIEKLANDYGESRQSIGIGGAGSVFEVFASLETGTWTIIATMPNGTTCVMSAGEAYEAVAEVIPEGDPA